MQALIFALAAFVGTHFLMSHPLRAPMAGALGTTGFQIVYSLVSLATFAWVIFAFRAAPVTDPIWAVGDGLWLAATVLMLIGSILFAGSLFGNPALPAPGAAALAEKAPSGVFGITRHPMMWGFAIWGLVHILVAPNHATLLLSGGMAFLAIAGSAGQDVKKAKLMGAAWQGWASRTSFIPFAGQLSGKMSWASAWPRRTVVLAGVALWLIASRLHPMLGAPIAGMWRWLG